MKTLLSIMMCLSLCIGSAWAQSPGPLDPLQGGENAAGAFVLSGPLPLATSGTTEGYADDYDETCPYPGGNAPDVVYSYTPASAITVDIDLCGSLFDTKLYVYENIVSPGMPLDCNDDFYLDETCGYYVSKIESLSLSGGNTYYIVIDGYDSDFGEYVLTVSETNLDECSWGIYVVCPSWALEENEECGADLNGGCDMAPGTEHWETVPATGATFCGTTWADGGIRDTDWFELVLIQPSSVILTANADQEITYGLVESTVPGAPDCSDITGIINPSNTAGPCLESFIDLGILNPGTYWFYVGMTADDGFFCDNRYRIEFEVSNSSCPPPESLLASGITSSTADLSWVETGSATAWEYEYGPVYYTPSEAGTVTPDNPVSITGLDANATYDFYVRSVCGGSGFSAWTGPYTFTTTCEGTITFPWSESFESAWPPACWTDPDADPYGWDQSVYGFERSGSEWAYCNKASSILISPEFLLPSDAWLVFHYMVENASSPQDLTVKVGNDVIFQVAGAANEAYQEVKVPLTSYTGQVISVSFTGGTGSGGTNPGICLDDVSIKSGFSWTGDASTSWNDPANWNISDVPDQSDIVTIPSSPSGGRFPEIYNSIAAECYSIIIETGATLQVKTGGVLNVKNP